MDDTASKSASSSNTVSIDDEMATSTAKIDNLEHFPVEILEKIFTTTNDIDLLHLADTCTKFTAIAQSVFGSRYAHQHFIINDVGSCGDSEYYLAVFNHFGSNINGIQFNHANFFEADHYVVEMLQPHANHIQKLTFESCRFATGDDDLLSQFGNITHLVIRNGSTAKKDLPEFGNLIGLEIRRFDFSMDSIERIIRNNPTIQVLLLHEFNISSTSDSLRSNAYNLLPLIADNLHQIKELALMGKMDCAMERAAQLRHPVTEIQPIVTALRTLENIKSLILPVDFMSIQLLPHIGTMPIEHLGLYINSSHRLYSVFINNELITSDTLPNFHHLITESNDFWNYSVFLRLIIKYPSLEKITIIHKSYDEVFSEFSVYVNFFNEFMKTIAMAGTLNAQIEIKMKDEIIGSVSTNGLIWRNKLMYWNGCNENSSNVQLLDLAGQPNVFNESDITESGKKGDVDQLNLLDRILDYLDVQSLRSFADTSDQSKRFVKGYVKKHLKKQGMITITDEIHPFGWEDKLFLNAFEIKQYASNLKIQMFRNSIAAENVLNFFLMSKS